MTVAAAGAPRWQKLHPLTPVVLAGRSAVVLELVIGEDSARGGGGGRSWLPSGSWPWPWW